MRIEVENGYAIITEDDMNEDELVLDMVEAYEKRQGTGRQLVEMAIDYANEQNKALTLCAYPQDDSIDLDTLVSFYEAIGFEIEYDDDSAVLMRYN